MGVNLAFRHQRAIFGFVVLGLLILFSTAVLWGHYEKIIVNYQWLAKAGLALVDVIAIGLALWHFYAKHKPLKVWCYFAEGLIAAMMLVHAGAVLQLDSSGAQQKDAVQTAADVQAKLIAAQGSANAETEAARIKAAGEAAAAVKKQTGSTTLASRTLKAGTTAPTPTPQPSGTPDLVTQASTIKATTFLSEGYMNGGMYYWPALFAFLLFFIAIGISAFSESFEDANRNGIPDWMERGVGRKVEPGFRPPAPRVRPAMAERPNAPDSQGGFGFGRFTDEQVEQFEEEERRPIRPTPDRGRKVEPGFRPPAPEAGDGYNGYTRAEIMAMREQAAQQANRHAELREIRRQAKDARSAAQNWDERDFGGFTEEQIQRMREAGRRQKARDGELREIRRQAKDTRSAEEVEKQNREDYAQWSKGNKGDESGN